MQAGFIEFDIFYSWSLFPPFDGFLVRLVSLPQTVLRKDVQLDEDARNRSQTFATCEFMRSEWH